MTTAPTASNGPVESTQLGQKLLASAGGQHHPCHMLWMQTDLDKRPLAPALRPFQPEDLRGGVTCRRHGVAILRQLTLGGIQSMQGSSN